MSSSMLTWVNSNEPLWLFVILLVEALLGLYTGIILTVEYFYDRRIQETKGKRRINKHKVKVSIDKEGNTRIIEAPKGLEIQFDHTGE